MATLQYVGARYVPVFYNNPDGSWDWESGVSYEPLTMVKYGTNTYTSKSQVPATVGSPNENPQYWAQTGDYNGTILNLQNQLNKKMGATDTFVSAEYLGILPENTGEQNLAAYNAIPNNVPITIVFGNGTYNFSSSIILYNCFNLKGQGFNTTLKFTSTTDPAIVLPNSATSDSYAFQYRGSYIRDMVISGTPSVDGVVMGFPSIASLINIPLMIFTNILITGFKTGFYAEGYGHTLTAVQVEQCTIGFDLVHPEQVSLINCWANYCTTGLQTNVTKHLYGQTFNIIGGAFQRCTNGIILQQIKDIFINTYFEVNEAEDIIIGGAATNYSLACYNANIMYNTDGYNKNGSIYSARIRVSENINLYPAYATNIKLVYIDGYSKYNTVNRLEIGGIIDIDANSVALNHVYLGGIQRIQDDKYIINTSANFVRYKHSASSEQGDYIELNGLNLKLNQSGNNGGALFLSGTALKFDNDTNKLQIYYGGVWHNISVDS